MGACLRQVVSAEPLGRQSRPAQLGFEAGRQDGRPAPATLSAVNQKVGNVLGDQRSRWLRISCVYNIYEMCAEQSCACDFRPRQSNSALCDEQDGNWGSSNLLTICKRLHTSHIASSPNLTLMNTALSGCIISGRGENNF